MAKKEIKIVEADNSSKRWYLNGEFHREDGPAWEWADGTKWWCLRGKFHREDGPAVELSNGSKDWYLNNKRYSEEEFNAEMERRRNSPPPAKKKRSRKPATPNSTIQTVQLNGKTVEITIKIS